MISFIAVSFCVCVCALRLFVVRAFVRSFACTVWVLWGILCCVYYMHYVCTAYRLPSTSHDTHDTAIVLCVCACIFAFCAARKRASVPIPPVARFYFEQLFQLFSWGSLVVQTVVVRSINGGAATTAASSSSRFSYYFVHFHSALIPHVPLCCHAFHAAQHHCHCLTKRKRRPGHAMAGWLAEI